jgi:fluoride ion exporter CrcB/FEX
MALLLAVYLALGLVVAGMLAGFLLAISPSSKPHALKWVSLLAGTGLLGPATTFGLVYLWEKTLDLGGISEDTFFMMLGLPSVCIFLAQLYFFYGRTEGDIQSR